MINKNFWKDKRVFLTGHTGFKGAWLSLWLNLLGAKVTGYALNPPTNPSLFKLCKIEELVTSVIGDIRDLENLQKALFKAKPDIVIHMAAQPLVRDSYKNPVDTYSTNVMGTVNLLEAVRICKTVRAFINVTTDKCYENKERAAGYCEDEPLGGYDPYSSSKACSEIVTAAYRNSFFNPKEYSAHGVGIATARAGNVVGGGDWAQDRLIPDFVRAILSNKKITIRNPKAIRPWQHVLEPLFGYLLLAEKLYENGAKYSQAWNFGSDEKDSRSVLWIVKKLCFKWGEAASYEIDKGKHPHEAHYLKLDCTKVKKRLDWNPKWDLEKALDKIVEWTRAYKERKDLRRVCYNQIELYSKGIKVNKT
ncbi:CDP-glucose 4,6-dehydratase [candidate division WOR-1 bacterium RIFOXYC2_FULL_37_10]|nr:MAG: CDP-glucose 4,6-dehydratase [candidate division WOR-1 bacterium RIFOXYA2_FULL_37_7]OGC33388.1 MAG: CDP-glucose 4,6-dehydratase [candidate division WOR-1 bacterium RIFOXYC2_FULL_37_10]